MKTNELWPLLFNPFKKVAGWESFGVGLLIVVLTTFAGNFSDIYFDGVIDMHFSEDFNSRTSWLLIPINIITLSVVMWIAGFFISKNFRFIDILGTLTLARAPFLLISMAAFFVEVPNMTDIFENPFIIFESISFVLILILTFPILVWVISLMFNAFKVSTGATGSKLTITFIVALLTAEIISKITIYQLFKIF